MTDQTENLSRFMPTTASQNRRLPGPLDPRRGIIRRAALWPLCRHRHNAHYAGAEHRLNREVAKRYHENQACRAEEELIAELTAAMMGAHLGFASDHLDDHARYIGSWLKALRSDKRLILKAAAEAQRAVDWMFDTAGISDSSTMTQDAA